MRRVGATRRPRCRDSLEPDQPSQQTGTGVHFGHFDERFHGLNTEFFAGQGGVRSHQFQDHPFFLPVRAQKPIRGLIAGPQEIAEGFDPCSTFLGGFQPPGDFVAFSLQPTALSRELGVGQLAAQFQCGELVGLPVDIAERRRERGAGVATDYIAEAITFFKDEYNKVKMPGLTYEYSIGENAKSEQTDQDYDDYAARLRAIERLKDAGFITEYELKEEVENDGYYIWDYAFCKIDETQITAPKQAPAATEAGVDALTQKIFHEHRHHFENSIQEKGIDLNHKYDTQKAGGFYITKNEDDFSYKGRYINLSKKTDYYKVFAALYALLPEGGEVSYKDLVAAVKSRLPSTKTDGKTEDEMRKFIQRNLTDKSNGFMRYAGIPEMEDGGKPLIEVVRGTGVVFNNKSG